MDPELPPQFAPCASQSGPAAKGQFTSEFGVGQPASFESIASTLSPTFWGMHGGNHLPDNCTSGGFSHLCSGGNVMAQRNYGCDDAWATYFPDPSPLTLTLDSFGADAFAGQLYLCQLATALKLKSVVEGHRALNIFGLLTWQLGEMWPTWGSLEYSSGPGAVLGGRWKPSHYILRTSYASLFAACGADGRCFVKNDDPLRGFAGTVTVALQRLRDGALVTSYSAPVLLEAGAGAITWVCGGDPGANACGNGSVAVNCTLTADTDWQGTGGASLPATDPAACCAACQQTAGCGAGVFFGGICYLKDTGGEAVPRPGCVLATPPGACPAWAGVLSAAGCAADGTDCVLRVTVVDGTGSTVAVNTQLLAVPGRLQLAQPAPRVTAAVGLVDPATGAVPVIISVTGGPALFVTLFTLANGRFSDNVVHVWGASAPVTVQFIPFAAEQQQILAQTLRVNHLQGYFF